MSATSKWVSIVVAVVIIGVAWFFLDHRSGEPKSPEDLMATSTAPVAQATSTASTAPITIATNASSNKNFMHTVTINTNKGTIVFETYDFDAPKTSVNFITLAEKNFYNNLIFHRVISGFMIQGGDPTGTGMGGPGYQFADELDPNTVSAKAGYIRGTVAMANSGPNTNGSQFFIMQKDNPLPHSYTIFGKVISGMDVVDAIAATPVDASDKPITSVVMNTVTVTDTK